MNHRVQRPDKARRRYSHPSFLRFTSLVHQARRVCSNSAHDDRGGQCEAGVLLHCKSSPTSNQAPFPSPTIARVGRVPQNTVPYLRGIQIALPRLAYDLISL